MEVMKYVERIEEVRARPCGGDTLSKALLRVKSGLIPKPIKNGRINFWPSAELDLVDRSKSCRGIAETPTCCVFLQEL